MHTLLVSMYYTMYLYLVCVELYGIKAHCHPLFVSGVIHCFSLVGVRSTSYMVLCGFCAKVQFMCKIAFHLCPVFVVFNKIQICLQ